MRRADGATAFQPDRLKLARELRGWNQKELSHEVGLTSAAISQYESGSARPKTENIVTLAENLLVPLEFFYLPLTSTHEGFFRSLRRTSVAARRRARAIAHVAHDVATFPSLSAHFPLVDIPKCETSLIDDIFAVERIAAEVRTIWGLPEGPAPNMVDLLEAKGMAVIRLPLDSMDVDAFSLPFEDRPVVVLSSDKNDLARSRFDAAHELGHLVMHGEKLYGMPEVEAQAHWFAAEFLMPRKIIRNELPRDVNWSALFELKYRWRTSLAALLMRSKTLGVLTDEKYLTAIKAASARGWRRVEPMPLMGGEQPNILRTVMQSPDGEVARRLLPSVILRELEEAAML